VLLRDKDSDELVFAAVVGPASEALVGTRLPLTKGIAGRVAREKRPFLTNDAQHDPDFITDIDHITGMTTRSLLAVPLIYQERATGVIEVVNRTRGVFDSHNLETLEALASSAAIAIENARLYQAEQARRQEIEAVQRASLSLTASLDYSQVLETIAQTAFDLVAGQNVHIFLYDQEQLSFGAAIGVSGRLEKPINTPRPDGLTYSVARQGTPIIIPDVRTHPLPMRRPNGKVALPGSPLKSASGY